MEKKTLLFDLDGTLTDSGVGIIHCVQIALEQLGLPIPPKEEMRVVVGPPLVDSFARFGVRAEDLDEAVRIYRVHYQDFGKYENFPYPGIEELLKKLQADGHLMYVATSKPEAMSIDILEHFGLAKYFHRICGASMDHSRNSKDKVIEYLLKEVETTDKILMIGDTIYDVVGSKQLGIPCVAVSWGYGIIDEMRDAGALHIAENMDNLYQIIREF